MFQRSWVEAIDRIKDPEQRLRYYESISHYALDHQEPTFKDDADGAAWPIILQALDLGWARFENDRRPQRGNYSCRKEDND